MGVLRDALGSRDARADFDRTVPVLVVKIGRYPLSYGGLGAIRTLGRVGVPLYTITEHRFTPQAVSRFVRDRFVLSTTGSEPEQSLVAALLEIAIRLGRPTIALPTDDEAAILLAEHAGELAPRFILPPVPPRLARYVASKRGLHELCGSLGLPTPQISSRATPEAVHEIAREWRFPIVAKNADAWLRLSSPAIARTKILATPEELLETAAKWPASPSVVLQEYIPAEVAEDWIFHGYCGADSECLVAFTGVKYRSWLPSAGVTTYARAVRNVRLEEISRDLCRRIGYRGILDLDWRFDARDGKYNLIDFNPRLGANFRLFENEAGIDVVRALHLDLTGRSVPPGSAVEGRGFLVENLDLLSRAAWRSLRSATRQVPHANGPTELAWFAADDPLPALMMVAWTISSTASRLPGDLHSLIRHRRLP